MVKKATYRKIITYHHPKQRFSILGSYGRQVLEIMNEQRYIEAFARYDFMLPVDSALLTETQIADLNYLGLTSKTNHQMLSRLF